MNKRDLTETDIRSKFITPAITGTNGEKWNLMTQVPAAFFRITTAAGDRPFMEVAKANYHREFLNDPERSEYFVPVRWLDTVPVERAIQEVGMFGNQNTVCRPTPPLWRTTVERLKQHFPRWNTA